MNYRDRALLDLAEHAPCMFQIPGICIGGPCVSCHTDSSFNGKGKSIKSHDCHSSPGCHACHSAVGQEGKISKSDKEMYTVRAFYNTVLWWFENRLVVVNGTKGPKEATYKLSSKVVPRDAPRRVLQPPSPKVT